MGISELSAAECRDLLEARQVGRVALCTPRGPSIVPVNYVVDGDSVVFRTAPYGVLAQHASNARIAFEVDHIDPDTRSGWSVVATGPGELVDNQEELSMIRMFGNPEPWAPGSRLLYIRLAWEELTGRRVG